jgi:hypothetical protein
MNLSGDIVILADAAVRLSLAGLLSMTAKATLTGFGMTGQKNPTHAVTERVHAAFSYFQ